MYLISRKLKCFIVYLEFIMLKYMGIWSWQTITGSKEEGIIQFVNRIFMIILQDKVMFQAQLLSVRNSIMGPLTAASLEVGSYQRGYEHIVK